MAAAMDEFAGRSWGLPRRTRRLGSRPSTVDEAARRSARRSERGHGPVTRPPAGRRASCHGCSRRMFAGPAALDQVPGCLMRPRGGARRHRRGLWMVAGIAMVNEARGRLRAPGPWAYCHQEGMGRTVRPSPRSPRPGRTPGGMGRDATPLITGSGISGDVSGRDGCARHCVCCSGCRGRPRRKLWPGRGIRAGRQRRERSQLLGTRFPSLRSRSRLSEAVTTEKEAVSIALVAATVLDGGRAQAVAST